MPVLWAATTTGHTNTLTVAGAASDTLDQTVMPTPFTILSTTAELDDALERSAHQPIVIFKHSPTCGVSAQAHESISEWLAASTPAAEFFVVPVQASRALSNELTKRFGIRHESPQAMLFDHGAVVWHGSHYRATATAIAAALDKLATATSAPGSASR